MAGVNAQSLNEPVVQGTVNVKFQGADRVCNMLDGVALAVGVIVHRVDAPFVPRTVVGRMFDSVKKRVTEHHVGMSHIYLGTEHLFTIGVFAVTHLPEESEILLYAAIAEGGVCSGSVNGAAACADLFLGLVVYIGQAAPDEVLCPLVKLVEVI